MHRFTSIKLFLAASLLALLVGCNQKSDSLDVFTDADSPLRYVDADTPYLFAGLEPAPDEFYEKIEPRLDRLLASYQKIIGVSLRQGIEQAETAAEADEVDEADTGRVIAVAEKLISLFSSEGMQKAGFNRDSKILLYGHGLLPVLRITLNDVDAFEKTLAEFEAESGTDMQVATIDDVTFRFAGDEEARIVLAVIDEQVVVSFVPTTLSEDNLRGVLGLRKPTRSMADSGRLQQIAKTYNFSSHAAGFIDFEKIVNTFLDEPTGINAELLSMGDYDSSQFSDVCKAEIRSMAGIAPRLVAGYTELSAERMAGNTVLELRSDIADGLATLSSVVPGLGNDHGGLMSFGMSIDLLAAREFYEARLDALEEDPYECELLADLQAGVASGRAVLNQPVPPIVYGLKGFLAVVDNVEGLDIATKTPPTAIDMRFLLATDNAPGLVAMGAMFSPELATLNMQNDGKPVKVESAQMQGPIKEAWMAMNNGAVALAVGKDSERKVGPMLDADGGSPPPAMAMSMDAARYYSFVGDAVMLQDDTETPPEMSAAVKDMMSNLAELIDRVSVSVLLTDRGVEFSSITTLKD